MSKKPINLIDAADAIGVDPESIFTAARKWKLLWVIWKGQPVTTEAWLEEWQEQGVEE